jgi:hypothetical protein
MKTKQESFGILVNRLKEIEKYPQLCMEPDVNSMIEEELGNITGSHVVAVNNHDSILINNNDGEVWPQYLYDAPKETKEDVIDIDTDTFRAITISTLRISNKQLLDEFKFEIKSVPHLYLCSVKVIVNSAGDNCLEIRCATVDYSKRKVTLTISADIYERFSAVADKLAINKSKFVENKLKEFIAKDI